MYYIPTYREAILGYLPKGCVVAEIGVQAGKFSEVILNKMQPSKLHLIDPWLHHVDEVYQADAANKPQDQQDDLYSTVKRKFANEINSGIVELHRNKSTDISLIFPDQYFDFIYIDAMHYHSAVLDDLKAFSSKLKLNGIMAGHDFCEHASAHRMNFGVVTAVSTFLKRSDFQCFALSGGMREWFPSYFLARQIDPDWHASFVQSLISANVPFLELPDCILPSFRHVAVRNTDGSDYYIPSFL